MADQNNHNNPAHVRLFYRRLARNYDTLDARWDGGVDHFA